MIQIALNGNRNEHFVPKTTESIAESALSSVKAGAASVHFHPRDTNGNETLKAEFTDVQIKKLRKKLSKTPLGISTGAWIEPDLKKRLEQISSWKELPDFVSVNYDEFGFGQVTELISEKGIKVEVGLSNLAAASNFINSNLKGNFLRILIEPQEQELEWALKTVKNIETIINNSQIKLPFLLHGVDKTAWELLKIALEKNYQTRIGFEDTFVLPNGVNAMTNTELMEHAQQIKADCQSRL